MSNTDPSYSRIPADAADRWERVRRVCKGPDAVREGGFLPTLNPLDKSPENIARNQAYLDRAVFYNVTGWTRDGLLGLAFRKDPDSSSLPKTLEYLLQNADGNGVSIYQQSQAAVLSVLETGRHGLLVDYSESLKRPQIKAYQAEDIINWRTEVIDGETRLTLLVLHEVHEEPHGYETKRVDQWREFQLQGGVVTTKLWRKLEKNKFQQEGEEVILSSSRGNLTAIPFTFIGAQNNDEAIDDAPLYNLAHLNLAHYKNSADYEDMVWYAGQAQPWISGLDTEWRDHMEKQQNLYAGSRAPMLLPTGGAYGFAQPNPNTLAKEAMDQKEIQMASLGAQLLDQSHAAKTATQDDNEKESTTSVLSMVVSNVSEAYARAFVFCGQFMGTEFNPPAEYKINQDFVRMTADPQMIAAIVDGWSRGVYAKADARSYLRRINMLPVERTDEMIDADMASEGPAMGEMGGGTQEAIDQLNAAIALHEKHMNGTAPTTGKAGDASQQKMMDQMMAALAALNGSAMGSMEGM